MRRGCLPAIGARAGGRGVGGGASAPVGRGGARNGWFGEGVLVPSSAVLGTAGASTRDEPPEGAGGSVFDTGSGGGSGVVGLGGVGSGRCRLGRCRQLRYRWRGSRWDWWDWWELHVGERRRRRQRIGHRVERGVDDPDARRRQRTGDGSRGLRQPEPRQVLRTDCCRSNRRTRRQAGQTGSKPSASSQNASFLSKPYPVADPRNTIAASGGTPALASPAMETMTYEVTGRDRADHPQPARARQRPDADADRRARALRRARRPRPGGARDPARGQRQGLLRRL